MTDVFYQASVVVCRRYLLRLDALLDTAAATLDDGQRAALPDARLAPDMLPFRMQVEVVSNFALRLCFPLAGEPVPDYDGGQGAFSGDVDGLRARLSRSVALLDGLSADAFATAASRVIRDRAGEADLALPATEFLFQYALPNFFFHLTTAYAILRSRGMPVGKADFDGYHRYPAV